MNNEVNQKPSTLTKSIFDLVDTIIPAIIIVTVLTSIFFRTSVVVGESMKNTLQDGDRLFLNTFMYEPKNGDIIVINPRKDSKRKIRIIKRVIAVAGQSLRIDSYSGKVYVDGKVIEEPYISSETTTRKPIEYDNIPEGYIFVMGDNRKNSGDSRSSEFGLISVEQVVGNAFFRFWPFNSIGTLK